MKLWIIMVQILIIIFHICDNSVTSQNFNSDVYSNDTLYDTYQYSVIDCIVSKSYQHIPCGSQFTLVYSTYFIDGVNNFLGYKSCYSFLSRSFEIRKWSIWTDVYIFYLKNYHEMYVSFTTLSNDVLWNSRAHFFVVVNDLHKSEYLKVFNILLNHNIFNVILITKSNKRFSAFMYHPFDNGNCGRSINKIEEINDCRNVHVIRMNYTHLHNKLRNCTIAIAAIEDMPNVIFNSKEIGRNFSTQEKGIEQYIIDNIAKQENLTIEYICAHINQGHGVILSNSTVTGVLGYLHNNTASVVIGGFGLIINRINLFDYIYGYDRFSFDIFTAAGEDENWKKVYQEFNTDTWFLIGLSFVFTAVVITVTRWFLLGKEDRKRIILKIWGYMYGQTDMVLIKSNKMRRIVIFWIWFTFFMESFYNSSLYSLLTRNVKIISKIDTTSLSALPWEPCISDAVRTFYTITFNETLPRNIKANCTFTEDAIDIIANNDNYYGLDMDYSYHIRKLKYIDENGNSKLKSWHLRSDLMLTMYTRRGFPLLHVFQRYAVFHSESGLLNRQRAAIYYQYMTPGHRQRKFFKIIRLSDFRVHFAILIFGYSLSLISFIIEFSLNKIQLICNN